ncbi:MAG: hypothetical protein JWM02_1232 [Frankiales bacterium]|nr:hypothetical protein [Frankiales bacterium]
MSSLLSFVSAGAGLVGVGVVGNWSTRRRDSLGRPRPFPAWSTSLLAVVTVAAAIPVAQRAIEERRLADVASQLVGHRVGVHCQTTTAAMVDAGAELGFVPYDANGIPLPRTTLKRVPCNDLKHYLGGGRANPSYGEVVAVHVLTHEAMHMRGQTSEASAECEAVQRDRTTAALLGATPAQAAKLALQYWLTVYPHMPEGYFTQDCKPGGAMDEHLASAPWAA